MRTLIFRTIAPFLAALMILFSIFVTLRGHNDPGGGFIGGLIAASAFAMYGIAAGPQNVRRALYFHPLGLAAFGLIVSMLSGLVSLTQGMPFLTSQWAFPTLLGVEVALSTPLFFDLGVYFVVLGALASIALKLEE
ncbi:MnhB domain-containing protein [Cohaesibacter celericrescens]|jgi:multicomponent Na+:H+ antiporter subunit B|uniref:Na(+)/H(+) antiporter subunit B n=1 Tax=Cohaesibacter celericrescens TaxID=2067669 RepID=A0A2N5XRB8_9HYPH|nr:MnhB domain-containing protein [Cohaesibacter celericrescens]PLW76987.1 Na(+)/H(+) antiporter subunit B [Cohaesibacter celericrescens]